MCQHSSGASGERRRVRASMRQLKRDRSGQAIKWRCTFLNTPPKFLLPASDNVGSSVKHRTDISGLHDLIFGDVSREEAPAARYRLGRPSVIGAQRRPRDAAWSTAKRGNDKGWHSPECCGQAWIGFSEARTARGGRGVAGIRTPVSNLGIVIKPSHRGETVMPTAEQCNAYAAEYRLLVQQVDVSIRSAATLMAISQSWTILADQLARLADITKDESKFRG